MGAKTILVAEDNDDWRLLMTQLLEREGHKVLSAASGREALALYDRHRSEIGLLVTDCGMESPMAGLDLIAALRMRGYKEGAILQTGSFFEEERARFNALSGSNSVIKKPYKSLALLELVNQHLQQERSL